MAKVAELSHADFINYYKNAKSEEEFLKKAKMDKKQVSARLSILRNKGVMLKTLAQRWKKESTNSFNLEALQALVEGDCKASKEEMPKERKK